MKVRDVMQTNLVLIHEDTPYHEVARMLYDHKITGAPIIDGDGQLVGIISDKDLFRVLYPYYSSYYNNPEQYTDFEKREGKVHEIKHRAIKEFMSRVSHTTDPETPLMKVGAIMLSRDINRLPVMEGGSIVGIVSRRDIFRTVVQNQLDIS